MVADELLERIHNRIKDESVTIETLSEIAQTVSDRVCLRLGTTSVPDLFNSIVVDASVKLYRRTYYEGVSSENDDGITTSFVNDILEEYNAEFEQYKQSQSATANVISFL